jgi:hypothetical protein
LPARGETRDERRPARHLDKIVSAGLRSAWTPRDWRFRGAPGERSAMQRRHCNDSQPVFPPAAGSADIHRGRLRRRSTPGKAEDHARNRGSIDRHADRRVCRPGRASGDHLWPPDCRSRADRLEPMRTLTQRRSEMKALWCGATALAFVTAVSFSPVMAQGPKPSVEARGTAYRYTLLATNWLRIRQTRRSGDRDRRAQARRVFSTCLSTRRPQK